MLAPDLCGAEVDGSIQPAGQPSGDVPQAQSFEPVLHHQFCVVDTTGTRLTQLWGTHDLAGLADVDRELTRFAPVMLIASERPCRGRVRIFGRSAPAARRWRRPAAVSSMAVRLRPATFRGAYAMEDAQRTHRGLRLAARSTALPTNWMARHREPTEGQAPNANSQRQGRAGADLGLVVANDDAKAGELRSFFVPQPANTHSGLYFTCVSHVDLDITELLDVLRTEASDLTQVEVKRGQGGYPQGLPATLSAFANMPGGGVIVIGLDERRDFAVTGVADPADYQHRLASQARQAVQPPLTVTFENVPVDGKKLVVARVHELPASSKPCRVTSNGRAYLRSYDGDYAISEQEELAFVANRGTPRFDRDPVADTMTEDLDSRLLESYLGNCRGRSPRLGGMEDADILRLTRVVGAEGNLTLAGLYALGRYPQTQVPTLAVTARVAPHPSDPPGTRSQDILHLDGPLPDLLDQTMQWVRRNTSTRVRFGADGHGRDEPEYPAEAVRELVANALVHRDLGPHALTQRVSVTLEHNRLVISNPGGLWGLTVDQLGKTGGGSARNQSLYDIGKDVRTGGDRRVIEGIGSGIEAVRQALDRAGMTAPRFIDAGIKFTAIVPNHALLDPADLAWVSRLPSTSGLGDVQRHVLVVMRHGQEWTNRSLRETFPMDSTDARSLLSDLVDRGLVEAVGGGRARSYRLVEGIPTNGGSGVPSVGRHEGSGFPQVADPSIAADRIAREAVGSLSVNGQLVINQLATGPLTLKQLAQATGLTPRQVGYALDKLLASRLIIRTGGPGRKGTTYQTRTSGEG